MIQGYQITEKLHETRRSVAYRAIRTADHCRVVLKMLNSQYPTPDGLARYRQEYELLRSLRIPGVIQAHGLEKFGKTVVIVLEDFGGSALSLCFERRRPTIEQLLDLAIQITAALGQVHQQGIIHKDVNPSNIIWNASSGQLKIIDFGIATRLSSESPTLKDPGLLEGTLPYVSPEQTGRMNRRLDYRTDFYSLGVTLYELLTGQLPFDRADALELLHCHIAAQPRAPSELRPDAPPILSAILLKLLAKTAEERYQSAAGLQADLETCLAQARAGQEPTFFALGRADLSQRFAVPQRLYGRAAETAALRDAFERVARGPSECVLVSGYSGIGKSSLVRELYRPITRKSAFFVSGKFDLLQRSTPYGAFAAACAELVEQLLTRGKDELARWQDELLAALGPNGRLLVDLVPALELVIGAQPPVEELGPTEAQNRLRHALAGFLRVFCKPAHPLVMFLDDLQWVDAATLRLLEPMMTSEDVSYFLFIGAYRDNEVDAAHPLAAVLQGITDHGVPIHTIHLHPLGPADMAQMLADTLHLAPADVGPLAELVLRRTGGNPFFINELLKTLHEEGLLRFDPARPGWRWDLPGIEAVPVTDSVVDLLTPKLRRFPAETQELLRLAACLGNRFDLDTVAIVTGRAPAAIAAALLAAVQEGYVLPTAEPELIDAGADEPRLLARAYQFAHDRVQQAAYALIPAHERTALHMTIGRRLLTRLDPEQREQRLFEIVDHLDLGRPLLATLSGDDAVTPLDLARLNLAAGVRAREATAYAAAARYLATGLELAGDAWDERGELALSLHAEGAMAEYCNGDRARAQALLDVALGKVTSPLAKARLYRMSLLQHNTQGRFEEGLEVAREALRLLGQPLPEPHELTAAAAQELARNRELLAGRSIESLVHAPAMVDETCAAVLGILSEVTPTAYLAHPELHRFIAARSVNLTLEHGQDAAAAMGYIAYATVLGDRFGDYQGGYAFGAVALALADRFHSGAAKCRAGSGLCGTIMPWVRPLEEVYRVATEAIEAGLQAGELQFAAFNLVSRLVCHFHHDMSLARVLEGANAGLGFSKRNYNAVTACAFEGLRIVAAHLSGDRAHDVAPLEADAGFVARCRQDGSLFALGIYYAAKCQALYLDQEYEQAIEAALAVEALRDYMKGQISAPFGEAYHALCLTALHPRRSPAQQREDWRRIEAHQAQMKIWADNCPQTFLHLYLLVGAEMARITGDHLAAMDRYIEAIEAAEQNEFLHVAALASELAARFFLARGQRRYAVVHLRDAHYGYARWGAQRKLATLEAQHPELLVRARADEALAPGVRKGTTHRTSPSTTSTSQQLDLATVIKASQALSSEISLDRLLGRLIEIVIESAGAQHGYLILRRRDRLAIEARGTLGAGPVELLRSQPLDAGPGPSLVSAAIVHYVLRTREAVVLHDAAHEGPFVADPHVVATRPRSVLCVPLLDQGSVSGVVYLENNLSPHAFTPARVELLALLSSQMAISLDNSLLYGNLQRSNQELQRLLYSMTHDLKEPLRAVQSFAELLGRRHAAELDAQGRDYVDRIFQAGQRMRDLLEAIRVISRIREIQGPHQAVPGERLVHDALKRLRPLIHQTGATVRVSEALPRLAVDPRWVAEALYQLVRNALQYTRDRRPPEIDIEPYRGSEGAGFVIKDRGAGVPEEQAEKLFELFRRAVGREVPGTGAGLAIARQVAARHGGNAWLRPRDGGGTEVYVTFG
jgi:predicted ATPase/signal transduction histidine kinase